MSYIVMQMNRQQFVDEWLDRIMVQVDEDCKLELRALVDGYSADTSVVLFETHSMNEITNWLNGEFDEGDYTIFNPKVRILFHLEKPANTLLPYFTYGWICKIMFLPDPNAAMHFKLAWNSCSNIVTLI